MKVSAFGSCLAKRMENFVALRRLAETDYQSQTRLLVYFDRFLAKEHFNEPCLTREIVQRYLSSLSYLHPRTRYNRFSVVSQFCRYLCRFEPLCYVPEAIRSAKPETSRIPYIFTKTQIQDLLAKAAKLQPQHSLRPHTYRTLFGLLYTTGLRVGEALALDIKDFYPEPMRLYIREGKFRKSRWVPLALSTCEILQKYIDKRQNTMPPAEDDPLFISLRHSRLHHRTVYQTFCALLKQCQIHKGKAHGPRIHDLRHSFAVHRLLEWYGDGQDINARLPALATYMGHVGVGSTQIYIQATPELYQQAHQRFLTYVRSNNITNGGLS
jgi:site-specific recombinase XerD